MPFLTRDLTAGLEPAGRRLLALIVVVPAVVAAVATGVLAFPLSVLAWAVLAIGCFAALRISGPQDARSFRLYRAARA